MVIHWQEKLPGIIDFSAASQHQLTALIRNPLIHQNLGTDDLNLRILFLQELLQHLRILFNRLGKINRHVHQFGSTLPAFLVADGRYIGRLFTVKAAALCRIQIALQTELGFTCSRPIACKIEHFSCLFPLQVDHVSVVVPKHGFQVANVILFPAEDFACFAVHLITVKCCKDHAVLKPSVETSAVHFLDLLQADLVTGFTVQPAHVIVDKRSDGGGKEGVIAVMQVVQFTDLIQAVLFPQGGGQPCLDAPHSHIRIMRLEQIRHTLNHLTGFHQLTGDKLLLILDRYGISQQILQLLVSDQPLLVQIAPPVALCLANAVVQHQAVCLALVFAGQHQGTILNGIVLDVALGQNVINLRGGGKVFKVQRLAAVQGFAKLHEVQVLSVIQMFFTLEFLQCRTAVSTDILRGCRQVRIGLFHLMES